MEAYVTAEANLASTTNQSADSLREAKLAVEADKDKQYFFDDNQGTVTLPFTFAYLPYNDEEVGTLVFTLNLYTVNVLYTNTRVSEYEFIPLLFSTEITNTAPFFTDP